MSFEPIAVVGQGCVLPGAFSPEELWGNVVAGRDLVGPVPDGYWGVDPAQVLVSPDKWSPDTIWSDRGGYVRGFDRVFDPEGFALPAREILELDEQLHWALFAAQAALRRHSSGVRNRCGLVLGNLAYPTFSLSRFAESVWLEQGGGGLSNGRPRPHARNRFHSGSIAHVTAAALGLGAGAFALDAACASSLYAIKLACDRLHDGRADLMLAGAVNRTDDLLVHAGFSALGALSRTGQSRPFNPQADGLVPAEGAALVALKRLKDAVDHGDEILGVIRGVGLSNDGKHGGFLTPSSPGQSAALRQAYRQAGLTPRDISLVECHATGTVVGDAVELETLREVFTGCEDVPLGSLKSNLGHLITAAGAAGLLKILGAFAAGVRPHTLHADQGSAKITSPFRLIQSPEPWTSAGPRRAALNAFGFGGNNAHLIVEEWQPASGPRPAQQGPLKRANSPVAVVALAVRAGELNTEGFADRLFSGAPEDKGHGRRLREIVLDGQSTSFPPRDLQRALPQQLVVLELIQEATRHLHLPKESTGVLVGMQCDAEVARQGMRIRLPGWIGADGRLNGEWAGQVQDAVIPCLTSAAVLGAMPNILANRINAQLDLRGPSFTVAGEELSGLQALDVAVRGLQTGETDAAVVAAVDLCWEPVHTAAAAEILPPPLREPGDSAVVLVLKRLVDAQKEGSEVLAILGDGASDAGGHLDLRLDAQSKGLTELFGHAHAASGLLLAAAAILGVHRRLLPAPPGTSSWPWVAAKRTASVSVSALGGQSATLRLRAGDESDSGLRGCPFRAPPEVHVYAGANRAEVLRALVREESSDHGPARLTLVASGVDELRKQKERAVAMLQQEGQSAGPSPGIFYHDQPIGGRLAFVGGSAVTAYPGMGGSLIWAFPELTRELFSYLPQLPPEVSRWYEPTARADAVAAFDKLAGGMFLTTVHGQLTRQTLGLRPDAVLGLSSGEKDVLMAAGLVDMQILHDQPKVFRDTGALTRELSGDFAAARRAWGLADGAPIFWSQWRTIAPVDKVRDALRLESRVHLTIIHTHNDVVIAGDRDACLRVLQRLGMPTSFEVTDYRIIFHAPELLQAEGLLRRCFAMPVRAVPEVTAYGAASGTSYALTRGAFLEAYLAQASGTVDFPRLIENAWRDGARVFVEHGPHNLCSRWIGEILGSKEHVAVALDSRTTDPLRQAAFAVAELVAAGVKVDYQAFNLRMQQLRNSLPDQPPPSQYPLRFAGHFPDIVLPEPPQPTVSQPTVEDKTKMERMNRAPARWPGFAKRSNDSEHKPRLQPSPSATTTGLAERGHNGHQPDRVVRAVQQLVVDQTRVFQGYLKQLDASQKKLLNLRDFAIAQMAGNSEHGGPIDSLSLVTRESALALEPEIVEPTAVPDEPQPIASRPSASPPIARRPSTAVNGGQWAPPPQGPSFGRDQCVELSCGKISSVFGPLFEQQDCYARQVRLPMPPLLLVDRITGIDARPGVQGTGTIWTETDVRWGEWYLQDGVMAAGVMVESGQADLTLISWMGADFKNRGERVYRLLGCDLTFHGGLPRPGDTLCYDIHINGHARDGDVRLFFFQYDCRINGELRMTVRNGQAGFFNDRELSESSGILWSPETAKLRDDVQLAPPRLPCSSASFSRGQVDAWFQGRPYDCFGAGYENLLTHTRTPRGGSAPAGVDPETPCLKFFDDVTHCDARGGPWGRGYLRIRKELSERDWFFQGHFHNDPCMPGTLMFEGTLQAMAFYLTWLGFTFERDGWRFEPIPDETYKLRCRGQALPSSRELICELFIEEVHDGAEPRLYADLLGTVDGLKAFHCPRMGLRLVPDWPLSSKPELLRAHSDPRPFAIAGDVRGDNAALLACAWGKPSDAFGSMFSPFDGTRRTPVLPGPPYHFMSRVTRIDATAREPRPGASIEAEYDVPPDAWYFRDHGGRAMPFSVLMEVNLQPCGWLAMFFGFPLKNTEDLYFRNLDGTTTVDREVLPDAGMLRTRVTLTQFSEFGGLVIVAFETACWLGEQLVYRSTTSFGFFTREALAQQVGLPTAPADCSAWDKSGEFSVELTDHPPRYFAGPLRLPHGPLRMIDRIIGYWPKGGKAGLGRVLAEQTVDPSAWYFKAHFFRDPVQPGSLGVEAMLQVLQFYMIEHEMHAGLNSPVFEPIASGKPVTWKYRGQVLPQNNRAQVEMEVLETGRDDQGPYAVADAWLWVDGIRIYQVRGLALRVGEMEHRQSC